MASEIRLNSLKNRVGLGTVSFADTGIIVSGIVTCTELSGLTALNIAGVGTANTLDINGDVDVDGHTNLDNVSIAGVTTFVGNTNIANDTGKLQIGASQDLQIYHDYSGGSENSHIYQTTSKHLLISAYTQFARVNGTWGVLNLGNSHNMLRATAGSDVKLYFNNTERITTTGYGATIAGITSATSFTASESGVNGEYLRNQIKWDRNNYNYIDCTNDSGQFAIRMGSSQTAAFSIDTSADTIFPNNRKIKMGTDKLQLYHDSSDNHSYIKESGSGDLLIQGTQIKLQDASGTDYIRAFTGGAVYLHNAGNSKFETTSTGVHVTGEVSASQDYPDLKPRLDFNFAATKKLDPRITYYRTGPASFTDEFGKVVLVGDNTPRFDHDPLTGESKGLLIETT